MKTIFLKKKLYFILLMGSLAFTGSCSSDAVPEEIPEEETSTEKDYGNIDDLMHLAQGSTISTSNVMGTIYQRLKATTDEDKAWLNDATQEPSLPLGKTESLELKPFTVELYPFGDPSPADCNQRALGNCSAIAVFAEIAYINPGFFKSIITDNGDNTYTVKMYDPLGEKIDVTVSNKFMAHKGGNTLAGVNGKNGQATWATILEKALMKYIDVYHLVNTVEGIGSEYASPAFTGDGGSFAFYAERLTGEGLQRVVEVSLAEGKIVIGGFKTSDVQVGNSKTVSSHAWSFSYAPEGEVNGYTPLFVMRNPWGNDNGRDRDGQMFIPNESRVTSLIDLRIINAGAAKPQTTPGVYAPPVY